MKDVTGSYKVQYPVDMDGEIEAEGETEDSEPAARSTVEIDFTPPFKRLPILETLEECLGEKLPDVNSNCKLRHGRAWLPTERMLTYRNV